MFIAILSKIENPHSQQLEGAVMGIQAEANRKHTRMQGEDNEECNWLWGKPLL